jgi:hypothetical protein
MAGPAYLRFVESMKIGYLQWHDGTGYDLQAFPEMSVEERKEAEAILIAHLKNQGDWRDVEALAALDTPRAKGAVSAAREHRDVRVRQEAQDVLAGPAPEKTEDQIDDDYVRAVELGGMFTRNASPAWPFSFTATNTENFLCASHPINCSIAAVPP